MNHVIDFRAQGTVFRFPVITKVCPVASFEDFAEENEVRAWTFELTLQNETTERTRVIGTRAT